MTTTDAAVQDAPDASRPSTGSRVLGVFRDPLRTFVLLALAVGGFLVVAVPFFGATDEPAHFYRSYQMSTGTLVPEEIRGSEFSGACVPREIEAQVAAYKRDNFLHLLDLAGKEAPPDDRRAPEPCSGSPGDVSVTFSTFGSPVPYLPQALALLVSRAAGADAGVMLLVGRVAMLAVYVGLVAVAIRRSPRAKWALAGVALVPVALFQSINISHDAITTAVSLLVVSSALRALDPPQGTSTRALVVEAVLLSMVLGSCKPMYVVLAGCYLLPLLGPRRRVELWPMVFAPLAGVATSVVLNEMVGDQWRTDAGYFGIRTDADAQRDELVTAPWHFVADSARTVWHRAWDWSEGLFGVGPSVTHWPVLVIAAALLLYVVVVVQRDSDEPPSLHWTQRMLLVAIFAAGTVLVFAGLYLYYTTPGDRMVGGVQARYLLPLLVVLPVAAGTADVRWLRSRDALVPVAVFLVPFLVLFVASVAFRMH